MSGPMWAIATGITFGLFQSVNRRGVARMDVFRATFMLLVVSVGVLAIASLLLVDLDELSNLSFRPILFFGLAGIIHFVVGTTLFGESQKRVGAARTGALTGATPLFATAIAAVILGEIPSPLTLTGILLVVAGIYLISNG